MIMTPETPPAAVNGLPELFDYDDGVLDESDIELIESSGKVEIRLEVTKLETGINGPPPGDVRSISSIAAGRNIGLYLDMSIKKSQFCEEGWLFSQKDLTTLNGNLIKITIELPDDLRDRDDLSFYRVHNGAAGQLSGAPNAFGETANKRDGYVILEVGMFSTYAIAYTAPPVPSDPGSGTSPGDGMTPEPPPPPPTRPLPTPTPTPAATTTPDPTPTSAPTEPPSTPDSSAFPELLSAETTLFIYAMTMRDT